MAQVSHLPVISQPRLPYPAGVEERFAVDRATWRALTDAVFPAAKSSDAIVLALAYCRARHLDPLKRPVHIVPMYSAALGREVETVWPGIGEHRITAHRTGQYAGCDEAEFGPSCEQTWKGTTSKGKPVSATVRFPEWCRITIYKRLQGHREKVVGPKVLWLEIYSSIGKTGVPNERWQRAPISMLEKCAEAAALRRAFPEEVGSDLTAEEMEGKTLEDVTDAAPAPAAAPPRPGRDMPEADPPAAPIVEPPGPAAAPPPDGDDVGEDDDEPGSDDAVLQTLNETPPPPAEPPPPVEPAPAAGLPYVAVPPSAGGRGYDWPLFVKDFKAALATVPPELTDSFVAMPAHLDALAKMSKQDRVGHKMLIDAIDKHRAGD
jgi:phage recombination protein Bet